MGCSAGSRTMTIETQVERFDGAVERFLHAVEELSEDQFLARINGWSPRDIVAHLIGWNRHVIEGSRQIARGELPFYDLVPGENYSKVNAALVRAYASRSREKLAAELRIAAHELRAFSTVLAPELWSRDFGVRHGDATVTIENTIDELIADYDHHREQIERLRASG